MHTHTHARTRARLSIVTGACAVAVGIVNVSGGQRGCAATSGAPSACKALTNAAHLKRQRTSSSGTAPKANTHKGWLCPAFSPRSMHAGTRTHERARMQAHTHARAHKHAVAASAPISYLSVRKSRRRRPSQHDRAMAEQRTRTDLGSAGACADARQAGGNRTHQASSAAQGQTRANVMRSNATHETRIHNRRAPVQGRQCQSRVYAPSQ